MITLRLERTLQVSKSKCFIIKMPEGAKERKMVGAAMHSCTIAAMMKMGGNKKLL
jgi:hypothetical protein